MAAVIEWQRCPSCSTSAVRGAYPAGGCLRCLADGHSSDLVPSEMPTATNLSFSVRHNESRRRIDRLLRREHSRSLARWVWVERAVDRHHDWYHERILDPDAHDPVREVAHPLSLHRGRGADDTDAPFADLQERGLEVFADIRSARGNFVWHLEVWRVEVTGPLRVVIRDRAGLDLGGLPSNARGLMQVSDRGQGTCDSCGSIAFHVSRRGSRLERFCFDHLFDPKE